MQVAGSLHATLARAVVCALLLLALVSIPPSQHTAHAATITVTTIADELNSDGDCSLREAIQAANTDTAIDACPAGSGADTIAVPAGTFNITIAGNSEDANASGDFDILDDLSVVGAADGATIIDAGGIDIADRVLHILSGVVQITNVTIQRAYLTLGSSGGGIANHDTLTLTDSTVRSNAGGVSGGGIYNASGATATIVNSTIGDSNFAGLGGGVGNEGTLSIENSTVADNLSLTSGGGGGLYNSGGTLTLKNTIVANNAFLEGDDPAPDCSGTVTSAGHNLVENTSGCTITGDTTGNITGVDPNLGPLADNGGTTRTYGLLEGSPAIDSGSPDCPPPATDQRGVFRIPPCDLGAFEVEGVGGIAELPEVTRAPVPTPEEGKFGLGLIAGIAAVAAAVLVLGVAAWYARRRFG